MEFSSCILCIQNFFWAADFLTLLFLTAWFRSKWNLKILSMGFVAIRLWKTSTICLVRSRLKLKKQKFLFPPGLKAFIKNRMFHKKNMNHNVKLFSCQDGFYVLFSSKKSSRFWELVNSQTDGVRYCSGWRIVSAKTIYFHWPKTSSDFASIRDCEK